MILLTGATGAAGSHIANEFVAHGVPVRILVRDRAKAKRFEDIPTVEVVEGNMSDRNSLALALQGVDRVLLISGPKATCLIGTAWRWLCKASTEYF